MGERALNYVCAKGQQTKESMDPQWGGFSRLDRDEINPSRKDDYVGLYKTRKLQVKKQREIKSSQ